jgi:CubicO group peptidase (beta-lactamase class C family)
MAILPLRVSSWTAASSLLLSVPLFAISPEKRQARTERESTYKRIEYLIQSEFAKDNRGGLTVGIVENGHLVWSHSYGFADEGAGQRATSETIYPIASLTKMVTGIMLLQLAERGKLHLADPVERYVPEVKKVPNPFPWAPTITLIQIATMTSGLEANQPSAVQMPGVLQTDSWEKQVLAELPYLKYDYEPGTRREYSNIGYCILGLALSRAANQSFTDYVQKEILNPLGMQSTRFSVTPEIERRIARGYFLGDPNPLPATVQNSDRDPQLPAGGLLSTLGDMVRLMRFQLGGGPNTVLSAKTLDNSFQTIVPSDGDLRYGDGVGFSAVRNADSPLTALGHGGLRRVGFVASYEFDRSAQTGVILLTNTSYGRANYKVLVRRILALLHPESPGGTGVAPTEEH